MNFSTLSTLPLQFWVATVVLLAVAWRAWVHRSDAWGVPAVTVCLTILVWYQGDALYNQYAINHKLLFQDEVLRKAWWEVTWFAVAFGLLAPVINRKVNGRFPGYSTVARLLDGKRSHLELQEGIERVFYCALMVWGAIVIEGFLRTGADFAGLFMP